MFPNLTNLLQCILYTHVNIIQAVFIWSLICSQNTTLLSLLRWKSTGESEPHTNHVYIYMSYIYMYIQCIYIYVYKDVYIYMWLYKIIYIYMFVCDYITHNYNIPLVTACLYSNSTPATWLSWQGPRPREAKFSGIDPHRSDIVQT